MKIILAFEVLLFVIGVAWLLATPDGPATAAPTAPFGVETPGLDDYAWQVSLVVLTLSPALFILYGMYLGLRYMRHKHEIEVLRAQRPIPEAVTHYTAPRLTHNPHYGTHALPAPDLPMLTDTQILPLHSWFPTVVNHPAHILLLGENGSGKSTLARALLTERAKSDKIVIIDPHEKFNRWAGIQPYGRGRNFDEVERIIYTIHREFERRFLPDEPVGEPMTVFIDEVPALANERKDVVTLIIKWLREARVAGIHLVVLSQGWEVKALGVQGEGSVRSNFLFVRLGNFVDDLSKFPPYIAFPAELERGTGKQEPQPIDTTGLPELTQSTLPPDVVWTPNTSSSSNNVLSLPESAPSEKKKKKLTEAQIAEIERRKLAGEKKSTACRDMFGTTGGNTWYAFQEVWDQVDG